VLVVPIRCHDHRRLANDATHQRRGTAASDCMRLVEAVFEIILFVVLKLKTPPINITLPSAIINQESEFPN
jgi:hypothetical protein